MTSDRVADMCALVYLSRSNTCKSTLLSCVALTTSGSLACTPLEFRPCESEVTLSRR